MTELTPKQRLFVNQYLIDRNATQAAIRAGYSKKTAKSQGARLLTNVDIKALVEKKEQTLQERLGITQEYVLNNLKEIADFNRVEEDRTIGSGDNVRILKRQRDPAAAIKSTELLGKHLGLFTEKVEITGKDGKELIPTDDSLRLTAKRLATFLSNPKLYQK